MQVTNNKTYPFNVSIDYESNTFQLVNSESNPQIATHQEGIALLNSLQKIIQFNMHCVNSRLPRVEILKIISYKSDITISEISNLPFLEKIRACFVCPNFESTITLCHNYLKDETGYKLGFGMISKDIMLNIINELNLVSAYRLIKTCKTIHNLCIDSFLMKYDNNKNK